MSHLTVVMLRPSTSGKGRQCPPAAPSCPHTPLSALPQAISTLLNVQGGGAFAHIEFSGEGPGTVGW